MRIEKTCLFCSKKFLVYPFRINKAKFCSTSCFHKSGVSLETRKKIKINRKGKMVGIDNPRWRGGKIEMLRRQRERKRKIRVCESCNAIKWAKIIDFRNSFINIKQNA